MVGLNLLREGLDRPEVSLVAILHADKEGYLRSSTCLIQTIGRAARNLNGTVILYADVMTDSLKRAIGETNRRREVQQALMKGLSGENAYVTTGPTRTYTAPHGVYKGSAAVWRRWSRSS